MIIIIKLKSNETINPIMAIAGMIFLLLAWRELLLFEALPEAVTYLRKIEYYVVDFHFDESEK